MGPVLTAASGVTSDKQWCAIGHPDQSGASTKEVLVRSAKMYQRYAALCLQEARSTTDARLKAFLIEMSQEWQRLADQAKTTAALQQARSSEPDRGD
jgi:hypothetical protein